MRKIVKIHRCRVNGKQPFKINRERRTEGLTLEYDTPDGKVFIIVKWWIDTQFLCEVFIRFNNPGHPLTTAAEAIGKLISSELQSGNSAIKIIRKLSRIRGGGDPRWNYGRLIVSLPDAIAAAMQETLKEINNSQRKGSNDG